MMMEPKKNRIQRIFTQAFPAPPRWTDWFFDEVYSDDEAMLLTKDGNAVSTLMLMDYAYSFHGRSLPMGYIYGATTARDVRGKGFMSQLIADAIGRAHEQGMAFVSLVPSEDRLFRFYARFGFATVFYNDCCRYTSAHIFAPDPVFGAVEPTYALFSRLEQLRSSTVLHSDRQFGHIIRDIALYRGLVHAVADDTGERGAMAFAVHSADGSRVEVRELLATDDGAAESVLALVSASMPLNPITVFAPAGSRIVRLEPRGMMRITDAAKVLDTVAAADPRTEQVIRVHDKLIPDNNGVYILHNGECQHTDSTMRRLTLDVDVATLTSVLFSSESMGAVFGLPTQRGCLPLMLD